MQIIWEINIVVNYSIYMHRTEHTVIWNGMEIFIRVANLLQKIVQLSRTITLSSVNYSI